MIDCGNLFSKQRWTQEVIFVEEGHFEISENRNPSKITCYMVSYLQGELCVFKLIKLDVQIRPVFADLIIIALFKLLV